MSSSIICLAFYPMRQITTHGSSDAADAISSLTWTPSGYKSMRMSPARLTISAACFYCEHHTNLVGVESSSGLSIRRGQSAAACLTIQHCFSGESTIGQYWPL